MKYEDIFKIYPHKEDKLMESAAGHNIRMLMEKSMDPAKLSASARREQLSARFQQSNSRMLVDARENPHERIVPEGFCVTCQSFTTAYNSRGECEVCKTEVTADISEVKK